MRRSLACVLFTFLPFASPVVAQTGETPTTRGDARVDGRDQRSPTVGMRARIADLVLPGTELVAKPQTDLDAPIVIRILATRVHGSAFRYDLEYYGLDPGRFDLAGYLVRKDGSSIANLPSITVEIRPILPPGQVEPQRLEPLAPPGLGGYGTLIVLAIVLWVLGLVAILWLGRRKRVLETARAEVRVTLADRLRPIVEAAQSGVLDEPGKAELERLLLAFWRRKLGRDAEKIGRAIVDLRNHDEAGPLLRQLEQWLHAPDPDRDVDVARLLEPYRDTPADFDASGTEAVAG